MNGPKTLEEVAAHLRTFGTPEMDACAAICEHAAKERAEMLAATARMSVRLRRCSEQLARAAKGAA
jgi:hypothetical protein